MPTYNCWSETGVVSPGSRQHVATALTEIHHEVARAPRYFVQVIFNEVAPASLFLAGGPVDTGHLWIRADIRSGRTDEQKRELLQRITDEVGALIGLPPESVWVYISDIPGARVAEYGRPLPSPGEEDTWFASLPTELQQRLTPLA